VCVVLERGSLGRSMGMCRGKELLLHPQSSHHLFICINLSLLSPMFLSFFYVYPMKNMYYVRLPHCPKVPLSSCKGLTGCQLKAGKMPTPDHECTFQDFNISFQPSQSYHTEYRKTFGLWLCNHFIFATLLKYIVY
jgi:hypothetical protein